MRCSLKARNRIAEHIQSWNQLPVVLRQDDDRHTAIYTAQYLIQDAGEAILRLLQKGPSPDPHQAYVEFWGLMQAAIIIQDSIDEMHVAVSQAKLSRRSPGSAWARLRSLRNELAGHPVNQGNGARRSFMGRNFGPLTAVKYEQRSKGLITHPTVNLVSLFNSFDREAAIVLWCMYRRMVRQWP